MTAILLLVIVPINAWMSSKNKIKWWTRFDLNGFRFYKKAQSVFTCKELEKLMDKKGLPEDQLLAARRAHLIKECPPKGIMLPIKFGIVILACGLLALLFGAPTILSVLLALTGLGLILVPSFTYAGEEVEALQALMK